MEVLLLVKVCFMCIICEIIILCARCACGWRSTYMDLFCNHTFLHLFHQIHRMCLWHTCVAMCDTQHLRAHMQCPCNELICVCDVSGWAFGVQAVCMRWVRMICACARCACARA